MWKRIHSNRDPNHTLGRELRREFGRYTGIADSATRKFTGRYPKFCFAVMIAALLASLILSFTLFRHRKERRIAKTTQISPLRDGLGQILQATEKIKMTIALKHRVDSIMAKKTLNPADSSMLDSALTQLASLRRLP